MRRHAAFVALAVALVLQVPDAATAIGRGAGPLTRLNFIEGYDAPIFFPEKALLREARHQGWLAASQTVWANAPDTSLRPIPGVPVNYGPPGELSCSCSPSRPAVMALFVRYANLAAPFGRGRLADARFAPPAERDRLWRAGLAQRSACLAKLQQTCSHVLRHVEDGDLVSILGLR